MALFGRTDLPIQKNTASSFIQWLVMVLVFMAAIAATVNAYTGSLLAHWNRSVTGTLTVQVPAPMERSSKPNDVPKEVAAVLGVLKIHPDVERGEAVPRAKVVALLEPWLGSGDAVSDLPLPALVDVALKPGTDTRSVTDAIMKAAPTALVDDHRVWLNRVGNLAEGVGMIALALMGIIAAALGLTVIFATRASLAEFRDVIEVLHLVGARDDDIAGQFARRALGQATAGGLLGLALYAPALGVIALLARRVDTSVLPNVGLPIAHWALLASLPIVAGLLAMGAAHVTVRRALRTMV